MSDNNPPEDRSNSYFALIPQDKSGSANAVVMGYSVMDIVLTFVPAAAAMTVMTNLLGFELGPKVFGVSGTILAICATAVILSPWYLSPDHILRRNISHVLRRIRFPKVGEAARHIPGIVNVHRGWGALDLQDYDDPVGLLEQEDGTLVGLIEVEPAATTGFERDDWISYTRQLSNNLSSNIFKSGDSGFDVQFRFSQSQYTVDELDNFDDATRTDELTVFERAYAEEEIDHHIGRLSEEGVMDRGFVIAVPVGPTEGLDVSYVEQAIRRLPLSKLATGQYATQAKLMRHRIEQVLSTATQFGDARPLPAHEAVAKQREHWIDDRDGGSSETADIDLSQTTTEGPVGFDEEYGEDIDPTADEATDGIPDVGGVRGTLKEGLKEGASDAAQAIRNMAANPEGRDRAWRKYAPVDVEHGSHSVKLNGQQYAKTYFVAQWPLNPTPGILETLVTVPGIKMDGSIYVHSPDHQDKRDDQKDKQESAGGLAMIKEKLGDSDVDAADSMGEQRQMMKEDMDDGEEVVEAGVAITIRANSEERLQDAERQLNNRCNKLNIDIRETVKSHEEGIKTTAPLANNALDEEAGMNTKFDMNQDALASITPFIAGVRQDENGVLRGYVKHDTGEADYVAPLIVDRRKLTTAHTTSAGRSGSGKTWGQNENLIQSRINSFIGKGQKEKVVIADIARGYDGVVRAQGGSKVEFGITTINPWEISSPANSDMDTSLEYKRTFLSSIFMTHIRANGGSDEGDLRITLEQVITETFHRLGIYGDRPETFDDNDAPKNNPTNKHFFETIGMMMDNLGEYTRDREETRKDLLADLTAIDRKLSPFKEGRKYDYLYGHSDVDLDADTILFDLNRFEESGDAEKGMANIIATSIGYEVAKRSNRNVRMSVDEAHTMFGDEDEAERIAELVRAGRNYGLSFDFQTQASRDFTEGPASIIIDQCSLNVWHEVGDVDAGSVQKAGLSEGQAQTVADDLDPGDNDATDRSEALVFIEGEPYTVEKKVSDYAKALFSYTEDEHGDFADYMVENTHLTEDDVEAYRERMQEQTPTVDADVTAEDSETDETTEGICGFIKDNGEPCQLNAGWGVDGESTGQCDFHRDLPEPSAAPSAKADD